MRPCAQQYQENRKKHTGWLSINLKAPGGAGNQQQMRSARSSSRLYMGWGGWGVLVDTPLQHRVDVGLRVSGSAAQGCVPTTGGHAAPPAWWGLSGGSREDRPSLESVGAV